VSRLLHHELCMRYVSIDDVTIDEALVTPFIGRGLPSGRSRMTVLLAGRGEIRFSGRSIPLVPGTVVTVSDLDHTTCRLEPLSRVLELDWDPGLLGDACRGVEEGSVTNVNSLAVASQAVSRVGEQPSTVAAELLARLRAEGLMVRAPPPAELHDERALKFATLNVAIDTVFSLLSSQPMTIDLTDQLGFCRRTLTRQIAMYNEHFKQEGLGGVDWRSTLHFWRLLAGTVLITGRNAQVSEVARALGYAGADALCHAFEGVGLPSPAILRTQTLVG